MLFQPLVERRLGLPADHLPDVRPVLQDAPDGGGTPALALDVVAVSLSVSLQNLVNAMYSRDISKKVSTALRAQMETASSIRRFHAGRSNTVPVLPLSE